MSNKRGGSGGGGTGERSKGANQQRSRRCPGKNSYSSRVGTSGSGGSNFTGIDDRAFSSPTNAIGGFMNLNEGGQQQENLRATGQYVVQGNSQARQQQGRGKNRNVQYRGQSWRRSGGNNGSNRGGNQPGGKKSNLNGQVGTGSSQSVSFDSERENRNVVQMSSKKLERKGPVFGFKRLYNFLDKNPDDVLLSINKDKEDWNALLESDLLSGEKLIVAIQILGEKICVDVPVLRQQQTNALTACLIKPFINKLGDAIPKIASGQFIPARMGGNSEFKVNSEPIKVMTNVYQFCSFVVKTMPETASDLLSTLITLCVGALCMREGLKTIMDKFKALNEQLEEILERKKKKEETAQRRKWYGFNEEDEAEFDEDTPPNSIQDIEVIPSVLELRCRSEEVFLRPNKQTGPYKDSSHYLDVQFRLFREDFVQPLREGIDIFLKDKTAYLTGMKKMPLGKVRLYTGVTFLKVIKERDTVVHKLQLNERNYKQVNWEKSKRLLTGCLILLTAENKCFNVDNTHFGIVFNRNTKELEKGILTVTWEGSSPVYDENENYFMLESEVYLEAYRYTLETMKTLELEKFPMKKFIVDANSTVNAPKYLRRTDNMLKVKLVNAEERYIAPLHDYWPSATAFGLDDNQMQAFRAALTKEFTIIQGPPGTGKTFLGLKVAEVLLNNSRLWEDSDGSPITVVCYTNHALDQFLEGILKFCQRERLPPEIIRIGGRCKSEILEEYSLKEARHRHKRRISEDCHRNVSKAKAKVYQLEAERFGLMNEVMGLEDVQGIVDFKQLSVWANIKRKYPKTLSLWNLIQNLTWLGLNEASLNNEEFSEEDLIRKWFQIRNFPKGKSKQAKSSTLQNQQVAMSRNNLEAKTEDEEEDEIEDYDLDELMENRILDDVFLEDETYEKSLLLARLIPYLPDCSLHAGERKMKEETGENINMTQGMKVGQVRGELCNLENRRKLLRKICRLYKEKLLDLPDVDNLLEEIRNKTGTVQLSELNMAMRWALYFAIVEWVRRKTAESIADLEKSLVVAQNELRNAIQFGDGQVLKGSKVVGLTTTGAAKYNNLLKMIGSKIVIVEEAAEIFESHIVTCITEKCEQLILIGDHRQLRPSPNVYHLATRYHLDLSLFERMLNNNLHCYQLKIQHRMRPEIADLVVGSIYDELINHDSVTLYPDVKGVTKNIFFITHTEQESSESDSMSKSNPHEAKFIAALCRYLIQQGYSPEDITVLTMYTGQMFLLKREMRRTCRGVRVTCVDNFQGEENKIILLSLVRSNASEKIGFVGIDNRICVSLSRAQHSLFVIGNMEQMTKSSETWNMIKDKLELRDEIGSELELECQIHKVRTKAKTGQDFLSKVPEGGCLTPCETILPCSHKCEKICHIRDKDHKLYKCREPCLKKCENKLHPCKGKCSDPCPPCQTMVLKQLNCGHSKLMRCHEKVDDVLCMELVDRKLPCNHEEKLACHVNVEKHKCKRVVKPKVLPCGHKKDLECWIDPASLRCREMVTKLLPCEHTQKAECWVYPDVIKCETVVTKKFPKCGHETKVKCANKDKPHVVCKEPCTRRLPCGHACAKRYCHIEDDPDHLTYQCKKPCSGSCPEGHKCRISHQCYKACPPCKKKVPRDLPCGHKKKLECHVDITAYECQEKCKRLLTKDTLCFADVFHECQNLCCQPCGPCQIIVPKQAPCGHLLSVACSAQPRKEDCEALVPPKNSPTCGHKNTMVPCKLGGLPAEEVTKFCTHPCGHTFPPAEEGGCGHRCLGTCSSCRQGRIHEKCKSACGRQLVCGHVCEVPCSAVCPPCEKPCLMKCEHSECTKKCGEPCSECKEKCTWKCQHKQCSMNCGELCDREPCNEPCSKLLKCKHPCVGFCGEPCPPLCRICDHEKLTSILFGNEEDEDARFVYLEDCGHTIEVEGLHGWLSSGSGGQIGAKQCPLCKTAIRNCRRFGKLIRQHYEDIKAVKKRAFGDQATSKVLRDKWIRNLNAIPERCSLGQPNPAITCVFPQLHERLKNKLVRKAQMQTRDGSNAPKIVPETIDEFSMRSLDFIADSTVKAAEEILNLKRTQKLVSPVYDKVVTIYRKMLWCMLERHPLSKQEVDDFNKELDRLDYFKQLMMRRSLTNCNVQNARAYPTYMKAKNIITSTLPFTVAREEEFRNLLRELDELLRSGLGITDRERCEILQAMGMHQGHWYKCPNGHIYVITECGGAMEESECNECGARIGGSSHRLRRDNQLAGEMDGANAPAWPTALNR